MSQMYLQKISFFFIFKDIIHEIEPYNQILITLKTLIIFLFNVTHESPNITHVSHKDNKLFPIICF